MPILQVTRQFSSMELYSSEIEYFLRHPIEKNIPVVNVFLFLIFFFLLEVLKAKSDHTGLCNDV